LAESISTRTFDTADACAASIIDRVDGNVRMAVPIGIGKPMLLVNALCRRAAADPKIQLSIFTGLTLTRPRAGSMLQQRFVGPLLDRLFPGYPEAAYVELQRANALPANIKIVEFFLQAGEWLNNATVQHSYTSLNYSHVVEHLEREEANVLVQLVAPGPTPAERVSLSSNTDIALDMMPYVARRRAEGKPVVVAGELNDNLPYMRGAALIGRDHFDVMLEPTKPYYPLFAPPKEPVPLASYAIALRVATLIKDGGTLQIGIGSFSDALTHALILRHTKNQAFRKLVGVLGGVPADAELGPFESGLYGCTEMMVDGFLALMDAGILKREAPGPDGSPAILHAGFFLGNQAFYDRLKAMSPEQNARISMAGIGFTNTLSGDYARKCADRRDARFVNSAMTATLLGALASDTLDDSRVVSGVGGQLDLISVAHQLPGARGIIGLRASRAARGQHQSNIVWSGRATTVPRSLRDLIVTEYGIADVRGRSDRDTIAAMLAIADAEFQPALRRQAVAAGKLDKAFRLPAGSSGNRLSEIEGRLQPAFAAGLLPAFPLGTEMTEAEQHLSADLLTLKAAGRTELLTYLARGLLRMPERAARSAALQRLGLTQPATLQERLYAALVLGLPRD
jgi:acyl-CoA hydrolase